MGGGEGVRKSDIFLVTLKLEGFGKCIIYKAYSLISDYAEADSC